jgi:predicted membrane channel-forming protein YqfA (hemolysin III family)
VTKTFTRKRSTATSAGRLPFKPSPSTLNATTIGLCIVVMLLVLTTLLGTTGALFARSVRERKRKRRQATVFLTVACSHLLCFGHQ